jgi:hypothetical protein
LKAASSASRRYAVSEVSKTPISKRRGALFIVLDNGAEYSVTVKRRWRAK